MQCPLEQIAQWLNEEKELGTVFPQGAVLSTVSEKGLPRSRVVGTMLDEHNQIKFHTSPNSRKINDINKFGHAALTYSFNNSLRSISLEGKISPLGGEELEKDWMKFDEGFRQNYRVFGAQSGDKIESLSTLRIQRDKIVTSKTSIKPESFVGFKFSLIERIAFYSVKENDFALNELYENNEGVAQKVSEWQYSLLVP